MRKTVERMRLITWQKIIQVDGSPDQPGKLQWKPSQPHAASCRSKIFCPLCGTETENYQRKTDVFEKKKKKNHFIIFGTKNYKKANPK